jgi:hypothetical protein
LACDDDCWFLHVVSCAGCCYVFIVQGIAWKGVKKVKEVKGKEGEIYFAIA